MKRGTGILGLLLAAALLASCGGGGGEGSGSTSYTGLLTPAVITDNNADEIALGAFQGGDLAANTGLILAPAGTGAAPAGGARPTAVAIVQAVAKVSEAAIRPATAGPSRRTPFTESGTIPDGFGGEASYTLAGDVNEQTGEGTFHGTFTFNHFSGDGGGVVNGTVGVSGRVTANLMHILFNFRAVQIVDGTNDVSADGTVDLTIDLNQVNDSGTATLSMVFTDNITQKTVWLSNYQVVNLVGVGYNDVNVTGRVYLHDYGYVNVVTVAPFRYIDGATHPESGQMIVTGDQGKSVRLTADNETSCTLEVDSDADGQYDDLTVTVAW